MPEVIEEAPAEKETVQEAFTEPVTEEEPAEVIPEEDNTAVEEILEVQAEETEAAEEGLLPEEPVE